MLIFQYEMFFIAKKEILIGIFEWVQISFRWIVKTMATVLFLNLWSCNLTTDSYFATTLLQKTAWATLLTITCTVLCIFILFKKLNVFSNRFSLFKPLNAPINCSKLLQLNSTTRSMYTSCTNEVTEGFRFSNLCRRSCRYLRRSPQGMYSMTMHRSSCRVTQASSDTTLGCWPTRFNMQISSRNSSRSSFPAFTVKKSITPINAMVLGQMLAKSDP